MPDLASTPPPATPLRRWLLRPLLFLSVLTNAGLLVWLVAGRIGHPFELEWMEGAMRDHVARILDGQALYTAPGFEHVCFLYHPLYFYAAAALALVVGEGYLALRLVSVLASLACMVFLFRLVRRSGSIEGGVCAVGIFLAGYSLTGCYADVGRIDPLFCALLLAGIDTLHRAKTHRGLALAGLLFLCCWLTKQTALVILPLVVLGAAPGQWRRMAGFGAAVAAACGLSVWLLDVLHDGWFFFYTLELPRQHGILDAAKLLYWTQDVLPLTSALLLGWVGLWSRRRQELRPLLFHGAWILACILGAYGSRLHVGGAENVLFPLLAAAAAAGGLGLARWVARPGASWGVAASGLALVQIGLLLYLPWLKYPVPQLPIPAETVRAQQLLEAWRADAQPRYLPWHGALSRELGLGPMAHKMALDDVWRSGNQQVIDQLNAAMAAGLAARPGLRVQADAVSPEFRHLLQGYVLQEIPAAQRWPKPVVGSPMQPVFELRRQ